ncbi:MAG: ATP-binding protein [Anaerolineae bacterium]
MINRVTPEQAAKLRQMPVEYELCMSLGWLSRLRWIAGAGVIAATWFASTVLGLGLPVIPLYAVGALILAYNVVFQRWLTQIQCDLTGISAQSRNLARLQIATDWIAMTALIHFSGGIESPIILYFFFHTTLAAILLSAKDTYIFTGLATGLLSGTALLEYFGVLPHHHVEGLLPVELYQNPMYVGGILFFFASTVFVSAYLATRTTRRLRARQGEMVRLGQELHRAYDQLETLYEGAQAVGSTLQLQEVLDRLTESTTKVMNAKGCTIRLLHETGTQLCLASGYGLSEEYLEKGCLLVQANPLVRQVLKGEVVLVPDIRTDGRLQYPAEAATEGIRCTLTAPLLGKTGPLGILRVYGDRTACFDETDQHFLATVAQYGSIAIENAMAYEAVQNLEESKRKFVLMVTHELRAPVGVVRSLLGTLSGGYAGELTEVQSDMINRALRRTEFLQTLIDDLLNLAASKSGLRADGEREPVELQDVVRAIAERYGVPAEEKGLTLEVKIDHARPLIVAANAEDLDRAVTNLVSNAVKYTPRGGRVTIALAAQDGTARLRVADTGIGMSEEAQNHLFEEFYRAPNAKAQVKQGTGLGLVITKEIVTRYGGTIRVDSALGEGTTFTVLLPLTDAQTAAQAALAASTEDAASA